MESEHHGAAAEPGIVPAPRLRGPRRRALVRNRSGFLLFARAHPGAAAQRSGTGADLFARGARPIGARCGSRDSPGRTAGYLAGVRARPADGADRDPRVARGSGARAGQGGRPVGDVGAVARHVGAGERCAAAHRIAQFARHRARSVARRGPADAACRAVCRAARACAEDLPGRVCRVPSCRSRARRGVGTGRGSAVVAASDRPRRRARRVPAEPGAGGVGQRAQAAAAERRERPHRRPCAGAARAVRLRTRRGAVAVARR